MSANNNRRCDMRIGEIIEIGVRELPLWQPRELPAPDPAEMVPEPEPEHDDEEVPA